MKDVLSIEELRERARKAGGFLVADPSGGWLEDYLENGPKDKSLKGLLQSLALFYESGRKQDYSIFDALIEKMPSLENYIKRVAGDYASSEPEPILEGLKISNRKSLSGHERIGIENFTVKIPGNFAKKGLPRLICKGYYEDGEPLKNQFNQVLPVEELCKSVGACLSDVFENSSSYDLSTEEIVGAIRYLDDLRESGQDGFYSALGGDKLLNKGVNRLFYNPPTKGLEDYVAEAKF